MNIIDLKIKKAIKEEIGFYNDKIKKNDRLKEDLGFDSLSLVGLIVRIEELFKVEFDESDLDPSRLKTYDDLYSLINKYINRNLQEIKEYA